MSDPENKPKVSLEFELTGERWDQVESYDIDDSFMVDADSWSVTVFNDADPASLRRKFLPKTPVRLYYGNALQLVGRIDTTTDAGESGKSLTVTGRDYLAELINANVDTAIEITNTMTLEDALLEALRPYGITTIETNVEKVLEQKMGSAKFKEVRADGSPLEKYRDAFQLDTQAFIDAIGPTTKLVPVKEKVPELSPRKDSNEGLIQWCSGLAARFGGTIQPGTSRSSIAVVSPEYGSSSAFAFLRPGNVESATARRDWSGIPTHATVSGRSVVRGKTASGQFKGLSISGDDSELALYKIAECKRIIDAARTVKGRISRKNAGDPLDWYCPIYYRDDEAKNETQLDKSARRTMAKQLRNTLSYQVTVKGHESPVSGAVYCTNVLADVQDSISDVNEQLWIMDRRLSWEDGEMTTMNLIRPASYVL